MKLLSHLARDSVEVLYVLLKELEYGDVARARTAGRKLS